VSFKTFNQRTSFSLFNLGQHENLTLWKSQFKLITLSFRTERNCCPLINIRKFASHTLPYDIPFLYSWAQRQESHPNLSPRHKDGHFQKNRYDTEKSNRYNRPMTTVPSPIKIIENADKRLEAWIFILLSRNSRKLSPAKTNNFIVPHTCNLGRLEVECT